MLFAASVPRYTRLEWYLASFGSLSFALFTCLFRNNNVTLWQLKAARTESNSKIETFRFEMKEIHIGCVKIYRRRSKLNERLQICSNKCNQRKWVWIDTFIEQQIGKSGPINEWNQPKTTELDWLNLILMNVHAGKRSKIQLKWKDDWMNLNWIYENYGINGECITKKDNSLTSRMILNRKWKAWPTR